jgi:hypothetical protein
LGTTKLLKKYAAFTVLAIDEWLLDSPDGRCAVCCWNCSSAATTRRQRRCTQYSKTDWHLRLGSGVHTDVIMDRIVHNTIWLRLVVRLCVNMLL